MRIACPHLPDCKQHAFIDQYDAVRKREFARIAARLSTSYAGKLVSIIAEAYLNSLNTKDSSVLSIGAVAAFNSCPETADITVRMNKLINECLHYMTSATRPHVWSVADIGEPGGISNVETERQLFSEEAYQEIVKNVDLLILGYSRQQAYLTLAAYDPSTLSHRHVRKAISPTQRASQPLLSGRGLEFDH